MYYFDTMANTSPRSPFDDLDADIIFRSSDEVDFRLYRVVIAKASPVFLDMLAMPNGEDGAVVPPVIPLSEDAQTLEHLLRLCYPVEPPNVADLDELIPTLRAADKYHMPHVFSALKKDLESFMQNEPLRVFAIAYIYKFGDLARTTARHILHIGPDFACPPVLPPELDVLPASALSHLLRYRQECVQVALSVTEDAAWKLGRPVTSIRPAMMYDEVTESDGARAAAESAARLDWAWLTCRQKCEVAHLRPGKKEGRWVPKWFVDYIALVRRNLEVRPEGRSVLADHPRIESIAVQGSKCTYCARAYQDLWEFSYVFAKAIDEAVSQVSLAALSSDR